MFDKERAALQRIVLEVLSSKKCQHKVPNGSVFNASALTRPMHGDDRITVLMADNSGGGVQVIRTNVPASQTSE